MEKATSFADLPMEIGHQICRLLQQSEISILSRVTKSVYSLFRPILYRHPKITSFISLTLFQRTITEASYMGKLDRRWSERACLDQTRSLQLTVDRIKDTIRNKGQPPSAVLLARMIQVIVRRCPNLNITLCFVRCSCQHPPISALASEKFPRVKKLVLHVGRHEPDQPLVPGTVGHSSCRPNAKFWQPLVNGSTFPDCLVLELRHYWGTTPPCDASLYVHDRSFDYGDSLLGVGTIGEIDGLEKLESISLESPPEFNSSVLLQLLGNPKSVAVNLKNLEFRFCSLNYETIAKLLHHAPPNLERVVLLCSEPSVEFHGRSVHGDVSPHLCPLIREFSKGLVHLEFGAAFVCRELFFDELEVQTLLQNGLTAKDGGIDTHAIQNIVQSVRERKKVQHYDRRIKEAIAAAEAQVSSTASPVSLFGGRADPVTAAMKAKVEMEGTLNLEEEQRARRIGDSKNKWFRRIVGEMGLCSHQGQWAEMQVAAEMEEKGVDWLLVNVPDRTATLNSRGKDPIEMDYDRALQEMYKFEDGRARK